MFQSTSIHIKSRVVVCMADPNIEAQAAPLLLSIASQVTIIVGRVAETSTGTNPKVARRLTSISAKVVLVCLRLNLLLSLLVLARPSHHRSHYAEQSSDDVFQASSRNMIAQYWNVEGEVFSVVMHNARAAAGTSCYRHALPLAVWWVPPCSFPTFFQSPLSCDSDSL